MSLVAEAMPLLVGRKLGRLRSDSWDEIRDCLNDCCPLICIDEEGKLRGPDD